jgi:hypothetical protein
MSKKQLIYTGDIENLIGNQIYINIKHLKEGTYSVNIVHNNKILKRINFKK